MSITADICSAVFMSEVSEGLVGQYALIDVTVTCSVVINQFSTLSEHKDYTSQLPSLSF